MYGPKSKHIWRQVLILSLIGIISCGGQELTTWQNIVTTATNMVKGIGFPRAGQPCANLGSGLQGCIASDDNGNVVEVPFLECKQWAGITLGRLDFGVGTCQLKAWIVVMMVALLLLIPLSCLVGICCCCKGC